MTKINKKTYIKLNRRLSLEAEWDIITLVTCSYEEKDSRLIVNAVKMD
ncbi:hypothetical protein [Hathewaya proteolytica]|nr:hypothetical protein [Hathewaya proteolytica]